MMLRGGPRRLRGGGRRSARGWRRGCCMPILLPACTASVHLSATPRNVWVHGIAGTICGLISI